MAENVTAKQAVHFLITCKNNKIVKVQSTVGFNQINHVSSINGMTGDVNLSYVKTVNGISPSDDGNVDIDVGSIDIDSKEDKHFIVTFTLDGPATDTYSCDKTLAEIEEASAAGRRIVGVCRGIEIPFAGLGPDFAMFTQTSAYNEYGAMNINSFDFIVLSDGRVRTDSIDLLDSYYTKTEVDNVSIKHVNKDGNFTMRDLAALDPGVYYADSGIEVCFEYGMPGHIIKSTWSTLTGLFEVDQYGGITSNNLLLASFQQESDDDDDSFDHFEVGYFRDVLSQPFYKDYNYDHKTVGKELQEIISHSYDWLCENYPDKCTMGYTESNKLYGYQIIIDTTIPTGYYFAPKSKSSQIGAVAIKRIKKDTEDEEPSIKNELISFGLPGFFHSVSKYGSNITQHVETDTSIVEISTNANTGVVKCGSRITKAVSTNTLLKTNTDEYTPTGDYNPATKKYVDDSIPEPYDDSGIRAELAGKQDKILIVDVTDIEETYVEESPILSYCDGTADKTFSELKEAIDAGVEVYCRYYGNRLLLTSIASARIEFEENSIFIDTDGATIINKTVVGIDSANQVVVMFTSADLLPQDSVYTKDEIDEQTGELKDAFWSVEEGLAGVETDVSQLKESLTTKANTADVYTKAEIDSMIGGIDALATAISEVVGA